MAWKLLSRLWNRRKERQRVSLNLPVRAVDAAGKLQELQSEDISETGVRLRFNGTDLARFVGHRESVPLEVQLAEDTEPVRADARLVWAYSASGGGTISGWQFERFEGNAKRRLQARLDAAVLEVEGEEAE